MTRLSVCHIFHNQFQKNGHITMLLLDFGLNKKLMLFPMLCLYLALISWIIIQKVLSRIISEKNWKSKLSGRLYNNFLLF